ncbi:hypothetical protein JOM56_004752 [Amanita muscaria]
MWAMWPIDICGYKKGKVECSNGKKVKVPRFVRMHSNEMEDVNCISPGEICAIFGVECASSDMFT